MLVVRLLAAIAPTVEVKALEASGISRDARVVRAYEKDPLVYRGKGTAGLAAALFSAMNTVIGEAASIELPILIMHGSSDRLTSVDGSQRLYDTVSSENKTLKIYEGLYHEILNEPERHQVMADIIAWLEPLLPAPGSEGS
jgi:alpha-beta hydrolase superfamily lysophospholipase